MIDSLTDLGLSAWGPLWVPILGWSIVAIALLLALRLIPESQFQLQLDSRIGLLVALPVGVLFSQIGRLLPAAAMPAVVIPSPTMMILEATSTPAVGEVAPVVTFYSWIGGLTVLAGLLTIAGLVLFIAGVWRLRSITKRAWSASPPGVPSLVDTAVLVSDETRTPFSCGLWRRRIVLPAGRHFGGLEIEHEILHHRHGDVWRAWVVALVRAVFFFHPLVHAIHRRTALLTELACDHRVLSLPSVNAEEYAEALLRSVLPDRSFGAPAIPMVRSKSQLKQRIDAMRNPASEFMQGRPVLMIAAAIVIGGSLLAACGRSDSLTVGPEVEPAHQVGADDYATSEKPRSELANSVRLNSEGLNLPPVSGIIRDSETGLGLVAYVTDEGTGRGAASSDSGAFLVARSGPGPQALRVSRSDYETAMVPLAPERNASEQVVVELHRRGEKWEVVVDGTDGPSTEQKKKPLSGASVLQVTAATAAIVESIEAHPRGGGMVGADGGFTFQVGGPAELRFCCFDLAKRGEREGLMFRRAAWTGGEPEWFSSVSVELERIDPRGEAVTYAFKPRRYPDGVITVAYSHVGRISGRIVGDR